MSVCQIVVVGNLGRDPETRSVGDSSVCNFSIAHNRKNKGDDVTDWYDVSAWGKLGEVCQKYLTKGSQIVVSGQLQQRPYTTKDGADRVALDIRANDIQFVGAKPEGGSSSASQEPPPAQAAAAAADDDIPF